MKRYLSNKWIILFLAIGLLKPNGIDDLASYVGGHWILISSMLKYICYLDILFVLILFILSSKKNKEIPYFFLTVIWFEFTYLLSNIVNGYSVVTDLKHGIISISICMLTVVYYRYDILDNYIMYTGIFIEILILINFISIVLYPEGMYIDAEMSGFNYFLGFKNRNIYFYLPCLLARYYRKVLSKGKIDMEFYVLVILMFVFSLYTKSSTTVVVLLSILVLLLYYNRKKKNSNLNFVNIFLYSLLGTFILFSISTTPQFQKLIYILFDKEGTFTGRTLIWKLSFKYFLSSPFLGNGAAIIAGYTSRWDLTQAHNRYIDMLYRGGIVMFAAYFLMIIMIDRNSKKFKSPSIRNITMIFFVGYSILFLMEAARSDSMFFYSLMLMYFSKDLVPHSNTNHMYQKIT